MPRKQSAVIDPPEDEDLDDEDQDEEQHPEGTDDEQSMYSLNDEPPEQDEADKPQQWEPSPPPKPLTTEQILKQIEELESFCAKAEARYLDAKSAAKAAKGDYDDAVYRMRQCIAAAANDGNRPILQLAEANAAKEPVQAVEVVSDEARRVSMENLMTPSVTQKLYEAGIVTVADLLDFLDTGKQLKDIKGIGPGLAEKIGLRMEEFWQMQAKEQSEATAGE